MRNRRPVLHTAVLLGALTAFSASVAVASEFSMGIVGGAGRPTGDFDDAARLGWTAGGYLDYMFAPVFGAGVDIAYHKFAAEDLLNVLAQETAVTLGAPPSTTFEITFSALQFGVHGLLVPPMGNAVRPFLSIGIAGYSAKEQFDTNTLGSSSTSATKLGLNGGAGVDFMLSPAASVGIGGAYHYVDTTNDFGGAMSWIALQGRVAYHLPKPK
jgi:opacity protein-like surface antigen